MGYFTPGVPEQRSRRKENDPRGEMEDRRDLMRLLPTPRTLHPFPYSLDGIAVPVESISGDPNTEVHGPSSSLPGRSMVKWARIKTHMVDRHVKCTGLNPMRTKSRGLM